MKWMFTFLCLAVWGMSGAQSVGIGTTSPNSSAQLDISSTTRGLLIPRMTTTAISAIPNPAKGLMVYDTVQNQLLVNMGTPDSAAWQNIISNSGWSLSGNYGYGTLGTWGAGVPINFVAAGQPSGRMDGTNVAFGNNALQTNFAGTNNVAIGSFAGYQGWGTSSVAIGQNAMWENYGNYNIAIGLDAGFGMTTGADNIAMGREALQGNDLGNYNIAIGAAALASTNASEFNTVVGFNSAQGYNNGYNNVFLGANNDVNGAGYYNVIAIGQAVVCTASSQARFGNSATNSIGGYANWTNFSDVRYKKNVREDVKGLDFIMRLRPITYNLDVTGIRNHLGQKAPADVGTRQSITEREAEVFSGFAAQEVEAAAAASGYEFSGVDKPKNDKDFYGLRYGDFVVPLVKAMQEQQKMIEELRQEVAELKKQIQH
jgi:hypothetical protein